MVENPFCGCTTSQYTTPMLTIRQNQYKSSPLWEDVHESCQVVVVLNPPSQTLGPIPRLYMHTHDTEDQCASSLVPQLQTDHLTSLQLL